MSNATKSNPLYKIHVSRYATNTKGWSHQTFKASSDEELKAVLLHVKADPLALSFLLAGQNTAEYGDNSSTLGWMTRHDPSIRGKGVRDTDRLCVGLPWHPEDSYLQWGRVLQPVFHPVLIEVFEVDVPAVQAECERLKARPSGALGITLSMAEMDESVDRILTATKRGQPFKDASQAECERLKAQTKRTSIQ